MDFMALLDPSTSLGAFIISLAAGILGGLIVGFITGSKYQKNRINRIKTDSIEGDVYQGNRMDAADGKAKNTISAKIVNGTIVQDSHGVANVEQKSDKSK